MFLWANMIRKTLYFGNPAYLSVRNRQLLITIPDSFDLPDENGNLQSRTIPIEDIGIVVLDNRQITITSGVLDSLLSQNVALITCDAKSLPVGMMLPLCGNTVQNERFRYQIEATLPLKKQLWQQTISRKIHNQGEMLKYSTGENHPIMGNWSSSVKSGDPENIEGRAAAYYWKRVFREYPDFIRDQDMGIPNNLLNYGYAILRAVVARALVGSGLLPTLGIHHHNRYDAYCLADDIMEPYRPYVDKLVVDVIRKYDSLELTRDMKAILLGIPTMEVTIDGHRSPLMVAVSTTTASLAKCFAGLSRKIVYPEF